MPAERRPIVFSAVLILTGLIGLWASFALTLDKLLVLQDPDAQLGCNFSLLVQCGANLDSAQGSILGFPNALIGLIAFAVPVTIGVGVLAGANFDRWFWFLLNVGVAGAFAFCIWLMLQSIFILGTLCPWCMVTWAATILMFWTLTLWNLKNGNIPASARVQRLAAGWYPWVPLLTLLSYLAIAVIAQLRLDVIGYLSL